MKNITLTTALSLGFDFSQFYGTDTVDEITQLLIDFLSENSDKLQKEYDECEVTGYGHHQNVNYGDYTSSGQIIDWHYYRNEPRQKINHSEFLFIKDDGTPISMNLWCWSCDELVDLENQ